MSMFRNLMRRKGGEWINPSEEPDFYGWNFKVNENATGALSTYFSSSISLSTYNAEVCQTVSHSLASCKAMK